MQTTDRLFIGGERVAASTTATIDVVSPHSEEIVGRELGPEGLQAYLEPKQINLPTGFEPRA
jgi:betaine-aldehyde dehydrogenase